MSTRREPLRIPPADQSSSAGVSKPCLVHLVRAANGPLPFQKFLSALRRCPPGAGYDLVLAFKGFPSENDAESYLREASDLAAEAMFFADAGYDLGVYFAAATRLRRPRYCFVNSFSEPLVEGWLAMLDDAFAGGDVGMAGASGSWNSSRSWVVNAFGLPSPYKGLLPTRAVMRSQFAQMEQERDSDSAELLGGTEAPPPHRGPFQVPPMVRAALGILPKVPAQLLDFEPFPAHHLRTNALVIDHATLARLKLHEIRKKDDAYVLESGRNSLTRQVQRLGLRAVVVDRAGEVYDQDEWHRSLTLWQRAQEGLLVADNQTRAYERGGDDRRRMLSAMAWGPCADPGVGAGAAPTAEPSSADAPDNRSPES